MDSVIDPSLKEVRFSRRKGEFIMKGKIIAIVSAFLFGATMLASPIVYAQSSTGTATVEKKPTKKKATKKKATKKKSTKKKGKSKKQAATKA
ncbi:MAG: hypothetical protein LLG06_13195 [Desulfobacteraceae bacterium]|nr:hypothetical protein [Desulfobacteraceae bacterium]